MSQVFQNGSALLSNGHGHRVSETTKEKVQTVFDALRANPKVGVQRLEGLLQQIPKVRIMINTVTKREMVVFCFAVNCTARVVFIAQSFKCNDVL